MLPAMNVPEVNELASHDRPFHIDDMEAIRLLRKFGEKKLPGISKAPLIFWKSDVETPDGQSWKEYWNKGIIPVGIGGSPLDEHWTLEEDSKDGESATSLTVKELEITDEAILRIAKAITDEDNRGSKGLLPEYFRAVQRKYSESKDDLKVIAWATEALEALEMYVQMNDVDEKVNLLDMRTILVAMQFRYPGNPEMVADWMMTATEAKAEEQFHFWTKTRAAFEKYGKVEEITIQGDLKVRLAIIDGCDDEMVVSYASSKYGGNAAVIINRAPSGHYFIRGSKKPWTNLADAIAMIRVEEQMARDVRETTDFTALRSPGKVEGAEMWAYNDKGNWIFNGRKGSGEASKLPMELIVRIIKAGLNPKQFLCGGEKCDRNCAWWPFGLTRCRTLRFEQSKKTNQITNIAA
jgi:hypothetical protein